MQVRIANAAALIVSSFLISLGGCSNVDWNWDSSWWKEQRRVVKPTTRPQSYRAQPERREASADQPKPTSDERAASAGEATGASPAPPEQAPQPAPRELPTAMRPFYHLYLVTSESSAGTERNEARVVFQKATPRLCGALLEMLYVPMGRSGSGNETYLIYEQREEFASAHEAAPRLDVAASVGEGAGAWEQGVAGLQMLVSQGAVVDKGVIARAESSFASVVRGGAATTDQRWAAAIFAGKIAADYRYAYSDARAFFEEAMRLAKPESIEAMTAEWWRADTFMQESALSDANEAYDEILNNYTAAWPKSHIVARSHAILRKNEKGK